MMVTEPLDPNEVARGDLVRHDQVAGTWRVLGAEGRGWTCRDEESGRLENFDFAASVTPWLRVRCGVRVPDDTPAPITPRERTHQAGDTWRFTVLGKDIGDWLMFLRDGALWGRCVRAGRACDRVGQEMRLDYLSREEWTLVTPAPDEPSPVCRWCEGLRWIRQDVIPCDRCGGTGVEPPAVAKAAPACPPACTPAAPCDRSGCVARAHIEADADAAWKMDGLWNWGRETDDEREARARRARSVYTPSPHGLGAVACRMSGTTGRRR